MADSIKLSSANPEDASRNGLETLLVEAVVSPKQQHIIIAVVNTKTLTEDVDSGGKNPTLRFLHVEVCLPDDYEAMSAAITNAYRLRTGQEELPFDAESDIQAAMGNKLAKDGTITPIGRKRRGRGSSHPGE